MNTNCFHLHNGKTALLVWLQHLSHDSRTWSCTKSDVKYVVSSCLQSVVSILTYRTHISQSTYMYRSYTGYVGLPPSLKWAHAVNNRGERTDPITGSPYDQIWSYIITLVDCKSDYLCRTIWYHTPQLLVNMRSMDSPVTKEKSSLSSGNADMSLV